MERICFFIALLSVITAKSQHQKKEKENNILQDLSNTVPTLSHLNSRVRTVKITSKWEHASFPFHPLHPSTTSLTEHVSSLFINHLLNLQNHPHPSNWFHARKHTDKGTLEHFKKGGASLNQTMYILLFLHVKHSVVPFINICDYLLQQPKAKEKQQ